MKLLVDNHEIHAINRWEVESYVGTKPYIVISITDTDKTHPKLTDDPNRMGVIRLAFKDLTVGAFTDSDAKAVMAFVDEHWSKVDAVVCHCEMGLSRSPAIAAAITVAKGEKRDFWDSHCMPNRHVYKTMMKAAKMKRKAFTLVELLVVIGIICLLAVILCSSFGLLHGGININSGSDPSYQGNGIYEFSSGYDFSDRLATFRGQHPELRIVNVTRLPDHWGRWQVITELAQQSPQPPKYPQQNNVER